MLGSSLFVALVINPVLTAMYMRLEEKEPKFNKVQFGASALAILFAVPSIINHNIPPLTFWYFFIVNEWVTRWNTTCHTITFIKDHLVIKGKVGF